MGAGKGNTVLGYASVRVRDNSGKVCTELELFLTPLSMFYLVPSLSYLSPPGMSLYDAAT